MIIKVNIYPEESKKVEKLFFKYNALLNVLAYLNDNCSYSEFLDEKINEATEIYIELDKEKTFYSEKYKPESLKGMPFQYTFDFENNQLIYETEVNINE